MDLNLVLQFILNNYEVLVSALLAIISFIIVFRIALSRLEKEKPVLDIPNIQMVSWRIDISKVDPDLSRITAALFTRIKHHPQAVLEAMFAGIGTFIYLMYIFN